jgi:hypothetical protein
MIENEKLARGRGAPKNETSIEIDAPLPFKPQRNFAHCDLSLDRSARPGCSRSDECATSW